MNIRILLSMIIKIVWGLGKLRQFWLFLVLLLDFKCTVLYDLLWLIRVDTSLVMCSLRFIAFVSLTGDCTRLHSPRLNHIHSWSIIFLFTYRIFLTLDQPRCALVTILNIGSWGPPRLRVVLLLLLLLLRLKILYLVHRWNWWLFLQLLGLTNNVVVAVLRFILREEVDPCIKSWLSCTSNIVEARGVLVCSCSSFLLYQLMLVILNLYLLIIVNWTRRFEMMLRYCFVVATTTIINHLYFSTSQLLVLSQLLPRQLCLLFILVLKSKIIYLSLLNWVLCAHARYLLQLLDIISDC